MSTLTPEQKIQIAMSEAELNHWQVTANGVEVYGSRNEAQTENLLLEGVPLISHGRDGQWYELSYDPDQGGVVATPKRGE
jgi:hypothetical protein